MGGEKTMGRLVTTLVAIALVGGAVSAQNDLEVQPCNESEGRHVCMWLS